MPFCDDIADARDERKTPTPRERLEAALRQLGGDELEVLAIVAERLVMGRRAYGALQLATDRRDFEGEALLEMADCSVYLAAALIRRRRRSDADERPWRGTGPGRTP